MNAKELQEISRQVREDRKKAAVVREQDNASKVKISAEALFEKVLPGVVEKIEREARRGSTGCCAWTYDCMHFSMRGNQIEKDAHSVVMTKLWNYFRAQGLQANTTGSGYRADDGYEWCTHWLEVWWDQ